MSGKKRRIDKAQAKAMAECRRERGLIVNELKKRGQSTVPEISEATKLNTSVVVKHIIALTQFGEIIVVGQKGDYLLYALSKQ